jgi:predicted nucleic acid-binding protein
MFAKLFLDTNVLLYSVSLSPLEAVKKRRAIELLRTADFAISTQVLQEYIANVGKNSASLGEENINAMLDLIRFIEVLPVTRELIIQGLDIRRRFKISQWDATIVAAALELGCETLYTEDLNHGQDYGGVRAINPFL